MRLLPASAVALPGRRRSAAFASAPGAVSHAMSAHAPARVPAPAPGLSVQDTRTPGRAVRVSWTLNRKHASPAPYAPAPTAHPAPHPHRTSSVHNTRMPGRPHRVSWTPKQQRGGIA